MENGEWRMENEEWRMENEEWRTKNGERRMENEEWRMENYPNAEANSQLSTDPSTLLVFSFYLLLYHKLSTLNGPAHPFSF